MHVDLVSKSRQALTTCFAIDVLIIVQMECHVQHWEQFHFRSNVLCTFISPPLCILYIDKLRNFELAFRALGPQRSIGDYKNNVWTSR